MRTNSTAMVGGALITLAMGVSAVSAARQDSPQAPLSPAGAKLEARYADQLDQLRTELTAQLPPSDQANAAAVEKFLSSDALDTKLMKLVILLEATPHGLAEFAQQGKEQAALVEKLLADAKLMKQMLLADGAGTKREGRGIGPAQYGQAMKIYTDIQQS